MASRQSNQPINSQRQPLSTKHSQSVMDEQQPSYALTLSSESDINGMSTVETAETDLATAETSENMVSPSRSAATAMKGQTTLPHNSDKMILRAASTATTVQESVFYATSVSVNPTRVKSTVASKPSSDEHTTAMSHRSQTMGTLKAASSMRSAANPTADPVAQGKERFHFENGNDDVEVNLDDIQSLLGPSESALSEPENDLIRAMSSTVMETMQDLHRVLTSIGTYEQNTDPSPGRENDTSEMDVGTMNLVSRYIEFLHAPEENKRDVPLSASEIKSLQSMDPEQLSALHEAIISQVSQESIWGVTLSDKLNSLLAYLAEAEEEEIELSIAVEQLRYELRLLAESNGSGRIEDEDLTVESKGVIQHYIDKIAIEIALQGRGEETSEMKTEIFKLVNHLKTKSVNKFPDREIDDGDDSMSKSTLNSRATIDPPSFLKGSANFQAKPRADPPILIKRKNQTKKIGQAQSVPAMSPKPKTERVKSDPEAKSLDHPVSFSTTYSSEGWSTAESSSMDLENMKSGQTSLYSEGNYSEYILDSSVDEEDRPTSKRRGPPSPEVRAFRRTNQKLPVLEEKKESDRENDAAPDGIENDFLLKSESFQKLYGTLSPGGNEEEKVVLAHVLRFCYPFLYDGKPTQDEYEGLWAEAMNMGLTKKTAGGFFSLVKLYFEQEGATANEESDVSRGSNTEIDRFVQRLIDTFESTVRPNLQPTEASPEDDSRPEGVNLEPAGDAEFLDVISVGSTGSNDAPWWEVSEKLGKQNGGQDLDDDLDFKKNTDETIEEPELNKKSSKEAGALSMTIEAISARAQRDDENKKESPSSVEGDIEKFWREQEELRNRKNQVRPGDFAHLQSAQTEATMLTNVSVGYRENVWVVRRSMALWGQKARPDWLPSKPGRVVDVDYPDAIDGVDATTHLLDISRAWSRRAYRVSGNAWKKSYVKRVSRHSGYMGVDINSLHLASAADSASHRLDSRPWEHRDVKQRFLYETSVAYQRNWFGAFRCMRGNKIVKMPVCRPKSMEMPMTAPGWKEDWFRPPTLAPLGNISGSYDANDLLSPKSSGIPNLSQSHDSDDESSWEEAPECGRLKNVRLRLGDRITRLTPDLTSSLRRSRWRRKHFPKGTFPY